ncbi:MAG TPA: hypothetical protein VLH38_00865 [Patescibacteria group bacterium]|nr:hypothetical protein [Patescibacteria group bacterium]
MRLSNERIKELQTLLKRHHGLELDDQQAQTAGMAILRFVAAKSQRQRDLKKSEGNYGQVPRDSRTVKQ